MSRRVVLATPTTLMALLRTVALTWQSEALSGNAKAVFEVGRELYTRLSTLGVGTARLGKSLERAVEDYNGMVATLERRVLVSARRLRDLDLTDADLAEVEPVTATARHLSAPELVTQLGTDSGDSVSTDSVAADMPAAFSSRRSS